jgi:DNA ligase (NAD+)
MTLTELRNNISRNAQIYYNGGERPVSDETYDGWIAELKKLCPTDPLLSLVGAPVPADSALQKVEHRHHMGSLNNAMNEEEFLIWHEKMADAWHGPSELRYNVSFKMDGASAEADYPQGEFVQGSTRGDGQIGEDITANMARMAGVPRFAQLGYAHGKHANKARDVGADWGRFSGFVRGEMMLFNEDWKELDTEDPSNPRNFGNGMARSKDGENCERMRFVAFRGFHADGSPLGNTESEMLEELHSMGFNTVGYCGNMTHQEVIMLYRYMQGLPVAKPELLGNLKVQIADPDGNVYPIRDELPFEIDGLVVKVEDLAFQKSMGETQHHPRAQIAFKFPSRKGTTVLRDVLVTVGHCGSIHPTGVVDPVRVGGTVITKCTLHNYNMITKHGVGIGDTIEIERCGDVIPGLVRVVTNGSVEEIPRPTQCPSCGGKLSKRYTLKGVEKAFDFCENTECPEQQLGKIQTWVKKLRILGLGDTYLQALYDYRVVNPTREPNRKRLLDSVARLYELWTPGARNCVVDVLGEKITAKVLAEIDKKRDLTVSDFLGSLGIDGLGRRRVILVQQALPGRFDTLEDWMAGDLVVLAAQVGLPNAAAGINAQIQAALPLIHKLLEAGVKVKKSTTQKPMPKTEGTLTFCLTGKFENPKAFYHEKITNAGHRFEADYRKGLDYLVASDPASGSSKMKKAAKDGVPVISDAKLLAMLAQ